MKIETKTGKAELCFVKVPEYAWDFRHQPDLQSLIMKITILFC